MKAAKWLLAGTLAFVFVGGCVSRGSSSTGRPIEAAQVATIVNGKTTADELQARFGPPVNTSMMPDGRRMLMWTAQTSQNRTEGGLGLVFLGTPDRHDMSFRTQTLQAVVNPAGVVVDHQFSDQTHGYRRDGTRVTGVQQQNEGTP